MHFATCNVAINGGSLTIVPRTTSRPVSWPEIEVLRHLHGDDAVRDVKPFVSVQQSARAEKERLRLIYGRVIEDLFPGKNPQMELEAPKAKLPPKPPHWRNPIIGSSFDEEPAAPVEADTAKSPFN